MIHSLRPSRLALQRLTLLLLLLVTSSIVLASVPVQVNGSKLEVVGPRTYRRTNELGRLETVPDLAVAGQIIVEMASWATPNDLQAAMLATNSTPGPFLGSKGLYLVNLPAGTTVLSGQRQWAMQRGVLIAEPNRIVYFDRAPNDPMYSQQWQWQNIDAEAGWDRTTGTNSTVVCVLDSGVDQSHPDLASRIWTNTGEIAGNGLDDDGNGYVDDVHGWDFQNNDNDSNPDIGGFYGWASHGTHCAGLVGAATNNGVGVAGHDWNCQIMSVKVGDGTGNASWDRIILALAYAVSNGADVVSMSFGGIYMKSVQQPIADAHAAGVVCVAAAGNSSWTFTDDPYTWDSPVCNDGDSFLDNHVLGVGATDANDMVADFSNLDGSSRNFVDVMSPGVGILSTVFYDIANTMHTYDVYDGTSMACPIAAGLASLVKSTSSNLTPDLIISMIRAGCKNIDTQNPAYVGKMGAGLINTQNALTDMPPGAPRSVMAFDTPGDSGGSLTVSWNTSLDDGRGFNDVVRYGVERSDTMEGPFTEVGSVDKGGKSYIDVVGPSGDYVDYYYRVVAYDKVNATASKVAGPAAARDDLAPDPVTVTAADTQGDLGGSISVTWSGYQTPSDFREFRVYRAEKSFTDVTDMTPLTTINVKTTKTYQDKTTTDNTGYYYAVTCVDNSRPNNEDKEVTCYGPVRSNPNYSFGFPTGLSMVAIGLTMADNSLDKVFDLSKGATVSRWDANAGTSGAYHTFQSGSTDSWLLQTPGRGFWLRTTQPMVLNLSGAAATTDVKSDFIVGWNQLGNPYIADVDITTATVKIGGTTYSLEQSNEMGYSRNYMWGYDNSTASYKLISATLPFSVSTVKKGEGFFFMADRPGQLIIPNPTQAATAQVAETPKSPAVDWSLKLCAAISGVGDTDNFLGVSADLAKADPVAGPPAAIDGFDFYFTDSGARTATSFIKTLGTGHVWQAELSCTRPGAQVKLNWPDLSSLPRDCRPVLRDLRSGKAVYMRTSNGYNFTLGAKETRRRFALDISSKAGDLLAIRTLQTGSVAGRAQIFYSLSAPASVDLEIINVAGRVVRRLQSGLSQAGACSALWDGLNDSGAAAPGGSYLVRLQARTEDGQAVNAVQSLYLRK